MFALKSLYFKRLINLVSLKTLRADARCILRRAHNKAAFFREISNILFGIAAFWDWVIEGPEATPVETHWFIVKFHSSESVQCRKKCCSMASFITFIHTGSTYFYFTNAKILCWGGFLSNTKGNVGHMQFYNTGYSIEL